MGFDWGDILRWLQEDTNEYHSFVGEGSITEPLRMLDAIKQIDRRQDFHKLLSKSKKLMVLIEFNPNLQVDWCEMEILDYFFHAYCEDVERHCDIYKNEAQNDKIRLHFILGL